MGEFFEARLMLSTLTLAANSCPVASQISIYLVLMLLERKSTQGHRVLLTALLNALRQVTEYVTCCWGFYFSLRFVFVCDITAYREVLKESFGLQFFAVVHCVLFLHPHSLSFEKQLNYFP